MYAFSLQYDKLTIINEYATPLQHVVSRKNSNHCVGLSVIVNPEDKREENTQGNQLIDTIVHFDDVQTPYALHESASASAAQCDHVNYKDYFL